jgi:hypothetical protein
MSWIVRLALQRCPNHATSSDEHAAAHEKRGGGFCFEPASGWHVCAARPPAGTLQARLMVLQQQAASAAAAASKTQRELYIGNLAAGQVTDEALRQVGGCG